MSLFSCPECQHQISTAAEACPHCGYPVGGAKPACEGPHCHACSSPATTRCQGCDQPCCVDHVSGVWVGFGQGTHRQLRCPACAQQAEDERVNGQFVFWIVFIVIAALAFAASKPKSGPRFPRHGVTDQVPALRIEV